MPGPFLRGARPTPRHRLAAAMPFRPTSRQIRALPAWFGVVPQSMNMEGNSTYGDCVTAEQAAMLMANSCAAYTNQGAQLVVAESIAVAWARAGGYLNGADLDPVIEDMQTRPMTVNGVGYTNGPGLAVDYTNQDTLCAAIAQGPVKLGIAADQLGKTQAGNSNGWFGTGWSKDNNEDHCVGAWGFGKASDLYANLFKTPVPTGLDPDTFVILVYTWMTVGVIDWPSFQATVGEAWLRNPTSPQMVPVVPTPAPTPTPGPTPTPAYLSNVPLTAGWFDPASLTYHAPVNWASSINAYNDELVGDDTRKTFNVPITYKAQ